MFKPYNKKIVNHVIKNLKLTLPIRRINVNLAIKKNVQALPLGKNITIKKSKFKEPFIKILSFQVTNIMFLI